MINLIYRKPLSSPYPALPFNSADITATCHRKLACKAFLSHKASHLNIVMRYRDILLETSIKQFYHGSNKEFSVGFLLTAQSDGYVHGVFGDEFDRDIRAREKLLEKYRPSQCLSRLASVFITDNAATIGKAGGQTNFIYEVKPIGACQESCLWWYAELENQMVHGHRLSAKLGKTLALNY